MYLDEIEVALETRKRSTSSDAYADACADALEFTRHYNLVEDWKQAVLDLAASVPGKGNKQYRRWLRVIARMADI